MERSERRGGGGGGWGWVKGIGSLDINMDQCLYPCLLIRSFTG